MIILVTGKDQHPVNTAFTCYLSGALLSVQPLHMCGYEDMIACSMVNTVPPGRVSSTMSSQESILIYFLFLFFGHDKIGLGLNLVEIRGDLVTFTARIPY